MKIRYTAIDEALRTNLKTLKRLVSVFDQPSPGSTDGAVNELIYRTGMELD